MEELNWEFEDLLHTSDSEVRKEEGIELLSDSEASGPPPSSGKIEKTIKKSKKSAKKIKTIQDKMTFHEIPEYNDPFNIIREMVVLLRQRNRTITIELVYQEIEKLIPQHKIEEITVKFIENDIITFSFLFENGPNVIIPLASPHLYSSYGVPEILRGKNVHRHITIPYNKGGFGDFFELSPMLKRLSFATEVLRVFSNSTFTRIPNDLVRFLNFNISAKITYVSGFSQHNGLNLLFGNKLHQGLVSYKPLPSPGDYFIDSLDFGKWFARPNVPYCQTISPHIK